MKNLSEKEKTISSFICSCCSELLYEPVALPCGETVCGRCFNLALSAKSKKCGKSKSSLAANPESSSCASSQQSLSTNYISNSGHTLSSSISENGLLLIAEKNEAVLAVSAYTCPSKECKLIHRSRGESTHCFANNVLKKIFPVQQDALSLVRDGEKMLTEWRNENSDRMLKEENVICAETKSTQILSSILLQYLNPSAEKAPLLQLVYVIRCKVLAQMGLFKEAFADANKAQEVNPGNKRGLCCEKMVSWMQQMRENNNCPFKSKKVCTNIKEARLQLRSACHSLFGQLSYSPSWNHISEVFSTTLSALSVDDLGCNLCLEPLGDPITTPCGHSFCRNCLISSLTHSKHCPLCRVPLPSIGFFVTKPTDKFISTILLNIFDRSAPAISLCPIFTPRWIPIYHGPLVYPNTSTSFHISETQYRVMIKRAIETDGCFGVMLPHCARSNIVVNHGTVVKITNFEPLLSCDIVPTIDGNLPRYVVQVTGLSRFKIDETRQTDASYYEGLSIRIEDREIDAGPWDPKVLEHLVTLSRSYVRKLFASIPAKAREHFEAKHGTMPLDPTDLSYWLAEFLPLNPYTLYQILPLTLVTERLQMLCNWMEVASSNHHHQQTPTSS